jgi:hypothetical protein
MAKQQVKQPSDADNINWHPGFFDAIRMEFYPYEDMLSFDAELQLTTDPQRIDVVVIKTKVGAAIDKLIGKRFKKVNLIEYKSPEESLSIAHFHRMLAYVHLYCSLFKDVEITEMTASFVVSRHPREVLKYIQDVLRWEVTEAEPGIWQVVGGIVPIQIIEAKLLPADEYLWLTSLKEDVSEEPVKQILRAYP